MPNSNPLFYSRVTIASWLVDTVSYLHPSPPFPFSTHTPYHPANCSPMSLRSC